MTFKEVPLVSVIVPAYNCALTIGRCITSILSSGRNDVEVIVVDDGSTDATSNIVKREAVDDSRIVYLRQENQGPSAARNRGIEQARGKIIMFVDSDDEISGEAIEIIANVIFTFESDVVTYTCELINEGGVKHQLEPRGADRQSVRCIGTGKDAMNLLHAGKLENYSCSYAYKTEFLKACRFRPEYRVLEDAVFLHDVLPEAKSVWCVINPPLYRYYMNEKSLVHVRDNKKALNAFDAISLIGQDGSIPNSYLEKLALFAASLVDYCSSDWKGIYRKIRQYIIKNKDLGALSPRDQIRVLLVLGNLYPTIMQMKARLSR